PVSDAPIGIFDSGVGGLTVARAILDQLPNESTLYIGDTARGPYGPRPLAEVREFALETMDYLVEQGVKAIVIACNTASAAMLRDARERYSIPVVEVIQPAVRRAVAATRTGNIGVIGTRATIDSKAYLDAFAAAPQLEITSIACPLFVEFVERCPSIFSTCDGCQGGHLGSRLHALPITDWRYLLCHGRRCHFGIQRRRNR
ncbi:MAG: hypothetical protein RLZZ193_834, partial [Actinomycetota bacterium]